MLKRWSAFLVRCGVIKEEDAAVQEYGLFCLLNTLAYNVVQLALALWFHVLWQTLWFDLLFMPLRNWAGGYHAKTPLRCFVLSNAVWALAMLGGHYLPARLCLAVGMLSAAAIWRMAPVPHENNPLSPARFKLAKRVARGIVLVVAALMCALLWLRVAVFGRLAGIVLFCTAVSLCVCKMKAGTHGER